MIREPFFLLVAVSCTMAILLSVKERTGTDAIFTSDVPSPLDNGLRSIAVNFFPLPQADRNRLNHGQNLKIINLTAKHVMTLVMFP